MNNYEKIGDTILIELPEEVDDYRAAGLVEETEDAFSDSRVRYVVFDFKHTNMMDSSGIGLVLGRVRKVHPIKGKVYLFGGNELIQKMWKMSGVLNLVTVLNSIDEVKEVYE